MMISKKSLALVCLLLLLVIPVTIPTTTTGRLVLLASGQSYHPSGVRRGAYMSLYSTRIGGLQLQSIAEADLYHILGNATREQMSLDFYQKWGFNALSFYNLHVIFITGNLTAHLKSYISRCRAIGITNIEATGSKWTQDYDEILEYNKNLVDNEDQKFDGLVTEIEFWMPGYSLSDMTKALNYGRSLNIPARSGKPKFYFCTYLGWVQDSDIATIAPLIDYMWPHAYNKDPKVYYGKTEERIEALVKAVDSNSALLNKTIHVTPIFSTESSKYAAGSAWFGGDALQAGGNFSFVEEQYHSDWTSALAASSSSSSTTPPPPISLLTGYQWYEYVFFYMLMKDIVPPVTPAPPTTTSTTTSSSSFTPPSTTTCANRGGAAKQRSGNGKDKFPWWIVALVFGILCLIMIGLIIYTKKQLGINTKGDAPRHFDGNKHTMRFDVNENGESLQMFMARQDRAQSVNVIGGDDPMIGGGAGAGGGQKTSAPLPTVPKKEETTPIGTSSRSNAAAPPSQIEPDDLSVTFNDI